MINNYLNKLYIYFEKARDDGKITTDELEGYRAIIKEYETENIKHSESFSKELSEFNKDIENKIEHKIEKEISKQYIDFLKKVSARSRKKRLVVVIQNEYYYEPSAPPSYYE
jgi:hypothetical protein